MPMRAPFLAVFDLDGTLADTAGGIANAVNRTLIHCGLTPLPVKQITGYVGDGALKLMERSLAAAGGPPATPELVQTMVDFYAAEPAVDTRPYPGVLTGLRQLRDAGITAAVLSNKPVVVGEKLLDALDILPLLSANIGGGSGFPLKPDPAALNYLLEKFHTAPERAVMIGDHRTDQRAAAAAGITCCFCSWGIGTADPALPGPVFACFEALTAHLLQAAGSAR